jgi:signal transduction histidine kinase
LSARHPALTLATDKLPALRERSLSVGRQYKVNQEPKMYESLIEVDLLNGQNNDEVEQPSRRQGKPAWQNLDEKAREVETLLLVIDASAHALSEPMETVLDLSASLLSQIDPDSSLADDLATIVREIVRMNEIAKGLSLLAHYEESSRQVM